MTPPSTELHLGALRELAGIGSAHPGGALSAPLAEAALAVEGGIPCRASAVPPASSVGPLTRRFGDPLDGADEVAA